MDSSFYSTGRDYSTTPPPPVVQNRQSGFHIPDYSPIMDEDHVRLLQQPLLLTSPPDGFTGNGNSNSSPFLSSNSAEIFMGAVASPQTPIVTNFQGAMMMTESPRFRAVTIPEFGASPVFANPMSLTQPQHVYEPNNPGNEPMIFGGQEKLKFTPSPQVPVVAPSAPNFGNFESTPNVTHLPAESPAIGSLSQTRATRKSPRDTTASQKLILDVIDNLNEDETLADPPIPSSFVQRLQNRPKVTPTRKNSLTTPRGKAARKSTNPQNTPGSANRMSSSVVVAQCASTIR